MIWRIFSVAILLVFACYLPVILTLLFGVLFLVMFNKFYEIIPIFFVNDMLYSVPRAHFFGFHYTMTLIAVVFVVISINFKKYIFEGSFMRS